jgi:hypothetical protein
MGHRYSHDFACSSGRVYISALHETIRFIVGRSDSTLDKGVKAAKIGNVYEELKWTGCHNFKD